MENGLIQQIDTPQNLYNNPQNVFVASFIGSPKMNFLEGLLEQNSEGIHLRIGNKKVLLPFDKASMKSGMGLSTKEILIGIRPEDIYLAGMSHGSFPCISIDAKIRMYELVGAEAYLYADAQDAQLTVRVSSRVSVQEGDEVSFVMDLTKIHIFDGETKSRIEMENF